MARQVGAGAVGNGCQVPGVYSALLDREKEGEPDPRYWLMDDNDRPPIDEVRVQSPILPLLLQGEPVVVIWHRVHTLSEVVVPRGVWPLNDRAIRTYQVSADDLVYPGQPRYRRPA